LKYDMSKFHLEDHQHKSGCPADPLRQDIYVVQLMVRGPRGESIPGQKAVQSRCLDCAVDRLFNLDETEIAEVEYRGPEGGDDGR
jgi:hypothetical protein